MLTVITAQLEVSEMKERSNEEYKKTIHSVFEDIRYLNEVSNRLLELARVSGENSSVPFSPLRVDEIIWQSRADVLKRNPQNKVYVEFPDLGDDPEGEDDFLLISGNEALLQTAFLNLMENACKFSVSREVFVRITTSKKEIMVSFEDKGTGIPEKDLPFIFEPFYRSQNTRTVKGHGIGLSIVAAIIKLHEAEITVKSRLHQGSTFSVTFHRP